MDTNQTSVHEIKQKDLMDLPNTSNDFSVSYSDDCSPNDSSSIGPSLFCSIPKEQDSIGSSSNNSSSNAQILSKQNTDKLLPVVLLANVQSFGKTDKTDKTIELELVLQLNNV